MRRHAIFVFIGLQTGLATAFAQQPPAETVPPSPGANPTATMEQPQPGDHWTYDVRDEILGTLKFTQTVAVAEVTPKEISTRTTMEGRTDTGNVVYDRLWNAAIRGPWRYSPNDGSGVRLPLEVGKTWSFKASDVNSKSGESRNRSGTSKVVAQESVTTKLGTFDTFKIQTTITGHDVNNPSRIIKFEAEMWYAPAIDHWIKRNYTIRVEGRLTENIAETLVSYGRKGQ